MKLGYSSGTLSQSLLPVEWGGRGGRGTSALLSITYTLQRTEQLCPHHPRCCPECAPFSDLCNYSCPIFLHIFLLLFSPFFFPRLFFPPKTLTLLSGVLRM